MISALVMTVSTAPPPVGDLALPHAVADHLAAAELHFLAIDREIVLHFDDELGIRQPHLVAHRGAEHGGIASRSILKAMSELPHDFLPETIDHAHAGDRAPASPRAVAPAQTAPPCRTEYQAACPSPSCGRSAAPGWFRRNDNASPPESAGRRYWQLRWSCVFAPTLISMSPDAWNDFTGDHVALLSASGYER